MPHQTRETDSAPRYRMEITVLCAALTCSLLAWPAAWAEPIGYSMSPIGLTQIDLATGMFSTTGPEDTIFVAGAAIGFDGNMYSVGELTDELWRIDPATATPSLIGETGIDVGAESGLTFDACGVLWMITSGRMYTLDPNTGAATFVSDLGRPVYGLTADGKNLLGLVGEGAFDRLARIEPATGTVTPFGDPVLLPTQRQGLDFDADGRLWGLFWIEGFIPVPWISSIVEYDPATGAVLSERKIPDAQLAAAIGGNLAIAPPPGACNSAATDIPGLSVRGLILLGTLLAGAAVVFLRLVAGRS